MYDAPQYYIAWKLFLFNNDRLENHANDKNSHQEGFGYFWQLKWIILLEVWLKQ
jgi:hypothetical protein